MLPYLKHIQLLQLIIADLKSVELYLYFPNCEFIIK